MRRVLPLLWWMAVCTLPLHSYSRDLTYHSTPAITTESSFLQASISGKVIDDTGSGMPGVNVIIKGTSNGTTTDSDGMYRLTLTGDQSTGILVFSFIGYQAQEQPINNRTSINVTMVPDVEQLSEVIVVGYGTQEKRDVTASISTVTGEAITKIPTGNAMDAMKGQIAGVDILQNGGRPGEAPTIRIRGRRSLTASNDPLFVIDGIPMTAGIESINDFSTADIASVEVLKDAASQAVYGSRGSNGVILITTQRGEPGKTTVNFSTSYGVTEPFRTIPMMNGQQFADMKREANRVGANGQSGRAAWGDVGSSIPADAVVFNDPVELNSAQNGLSTDWQDLIYQNGSQLNQNLSISGGTEKTYLRLGFNNFQEDGLIEGVDFKRYSGRINLDHRISDRFKVGVSSIFSNSTQNFGSGSVIPEAVNQSPLGLPYDAQGNLLFLPISDGIRSNPLSELVPGKRIDERKTSRVFASAFAEATIVKGLQYKFLIGQELWNRERGLFEGQFTNTRKNGTPFAQLEKLQEWGYTLENLLTYNTTFGEHSLGLTFLHSVAEQEYTYSRIGAQNIPYESALWHNLELGTITAYRTQLAEYQLLSYMEIGRAHV